MPYTYHQMTPAERAAAVAARRERGYPLHAPPHPYREGGWYCITAAIYQHAPLIDPPDRRTAFEDQLLTELAAATIELSAWVILTNHYHLLIQLPDFNQLAPVLNHLHGTTARAWNLADGCTGCRRVWYKYYDRRLRDEAHYYRALNYIHYNPVKHQYTATPYDWPWSSVICYSETLGREWLREQWQRYPISTAWNYGDVE